MENIQKSFNHRNVLKGVSLQVEKGEILAVIGGSGVGKSVLLKHIAALMRPDRGSIVVNNLEVARLKGRALEEYRDRLGYLFQGGALFDSMNVYDNIAFPLREKTRLKEKKISEFVYGMLEKVGMQEEVEKYPAELSGGMRKRAALARALIKNPDIMLFDEPTTGLDPITVNSVFKYIKMTHQKLEFTGIIVTHQIPRIFSIVQKVALLSEGAIVAAGTPEEIQASDDPVVQNFLSGGIKETTNK
ncbi:MAG: ATP-binding cassette domain-containing protein [Deltaproteobacteria bacterium]|nr:ATP-binding cassette domain-containing protein [Deltaproteobacteria bacterium]